jgi:hypothetical protein
MNYEDTNVPLSGRTNDDFSLSVDLGEPIGSRIPKMFIGSVDVSPYCIITGENTFIININAHKMSSIGVGIFNYDVILEIDINNNKFLFGGIFIIHKGVTP